MASRDDVVSYLTSAAPQYGVPVDLALKWAGAESGLDPSAVSARGATGVAQLMPGTAADEGVDPSDWKQNIRGGLDYLAKQYRQFGSWPLALRAYNAGPGRVKNSFAYPETNAYVKRITGMGDPALSQALASTKAIQGAVGQDPFLAKILSADKALEPQRQAAAAKVQKNADTAQAIADQPAAPLPEPPKTQDIPNAPIAPHTDTMKAFGQFLPVLAMFGSLFTRGGATTALNAATAAMKGLHDKDEETYKKARTEWLDKTDQVIKQNAKEVSDYDAIMKRDDLDVRQKASKLQALAAANGDNLTAMQLRSGELTNLEGIYSLRERAGQQLETAMEHERAEYDKQEQLKLMREREPIANQVYSQAIRDHKTPEEAMRLAAEAAGTMNVKQGAAVDAEIRKELVTQPVGKAHAAVEQYMPGIKAAETALKTTGTLNAAQSLSLSDSLQRILSNQAIRAFNLQAIDKNLGFENELNKWVSKLKSTGGSLSPAAAKSMIDIANEVEAESSSKYKAEIVRGENRAEALGRPRENVVPFDTDPDSLTQPLPASEGALQDGEVYQTAHGPAKWDASNKQFEAVGP